MKITMMVSALAIAAGCAGGYVSAGVGPVTTSAEIYDENPPVDIETSPRYAYHGDYVYNVRGRYYHRVNNRWMRYRERPRDLNEHR